MQVAYASCKKRVTDLHHESRLQAHIDYCVKIERRRCPKEEARQKVLTREQYLQAIPNWCTTHPDCWAAIVDTWLDEDWQKRHDEARDRRLQMPGAPHHQGSRSLSKYAKAYSASHGGEPIGQLTAYVLSHMGKATADIHYRPDAPPEAYTNSSVHTRLTAYTKAARSVHGPDYDPRTEERLDPQLVMRVGQGKKHGRFSIATASSTRPLLLLSTTSEQRARAAACPYANARPCCRHSSGRRSG